MRSSSYYGMFFFMGLYKSTYPGVVPCKVFVFFSNGNAQYWTFPAFCRARGIVWLGIFVHAQSDLKNAAIVLSTLVTLLRHLMKFSYLKQCSILLQINTAKQQQCSDSALSVFRMENTHVYVDAPTHKVHTQCPHRKVLGPTGIQTMDFSCEAAVFATPPLCSPLIMEAVLAGLAFCCHVKAWQLLGNDTFPLNIPVGLHFWWEIGHGDLMLHYKSAK